MAQHSVRFEIILLFLKWMGIYCSIYVKLSFVVVLFISYGLTDFFVCFFYILLIQVITYFPQGLYIWLFLYSNFKYDFLTVIFSSWIKILLLRNTPSLKYTLLQCNCINYSVSSDVCTYICIQRGRENCMSIWLTCWK